jgi:hypothetical protein
MAMRAATMSSMSSMDTPQTVRGSDSLFRKLVLLLLLVGAVVLWIVIWFRQEPDFPLLPSTFFADASIGLIAGFGARIFLRNRDGFVRYSIGILIAVVGMYMIGALTNWVLGVGPIRWEQKFAEQLEQIRFGPDVFQQIGSLGLGSRVLFDFSKLDWADSVHLAVSLVMTILSSQAWRRPAPAPVTYTPVSVQEPVEIMPMYEVQPAPRVQRSRRTSSNGRARVQSNNGSARLTPSPQPRLRSNNRVRNSVKKMKEPVVRPKKKRLFQRKPTIQLAMVEEHRCPYCLDPVSRNDPRGVKECDVCHTLHHADCWAITGVCQVPHLNT